MYLEVFLFDDLVKIVLLVAETPVALLLLTCPVCHAPLWVVVQFELANLWILRAGILVAVQLLQ